jgi:hypothetical protein
MPSAPALSSHDNLYRPPKKPFPESPEPGENDEEERKKSWRPAEDGGMPSQLDGDNNNNNDGANTGAGYNSGLGHSSTLLNVPPRTFIPSNCSTCRFREELRNLSLESIKEQILNKLGMKHAPNTTGRSIPKIPPLHHLLDLYHMQGDQPDRLFQPGQVIHDEEDDFHAKTTMVVAVAQTSKYKTIFLNFWHAFYLLNL